MAALIDDLERRGADTFSDRPFQELDGALLARLAYLPFEHTALAHRSEPIRLAEAAALLLQTPEAVARVTQPKDLQLLDVLANSARYRDTLLQNLSAQADAETQFFALTLRLAPQVLCLAFRGTDDTLIGWKEDFNMSFRCPVPAQELAAAYLWDVAAQHTGALLLCGHSKGGNLAVYAAANCAPAIQSRILAVYNYDGPGFSESVLRQAGYQAICGRVQTFVPQSSVIGMLLGHEEQYTVVHSARMGIYQHDLYSWDVENGHFVSLESVNQSSRFIDTTLKAWLASLTPAERERFIDAVFYLLAQTNAGTLTELTDKWFTNSKTVLRAAKTLDEPTHRAVMLALRQLLRSTSTGLSQIISLGRGNNESEKSLKRGTSKS